MGWSNKEKQREYNRKYHSANREKQNIKRREYHRKHKSVMNKKALEYYYKNKKYFLEYHRKLYSDPVHRKHKIEYAKKYHQEHREEQLKQFKENYRKRFKEIRLKVFEYYGQKCVCCGETISEFLTIDHINGGGSAHRKELKGYNMWPWIVKNGFPSGFQILCMNCNFAKGHYGKCPHQKV